MVPTVKIKCPENKRDGWAIINESDFDSKKHELYDAPSKKRGRPKKETPKDE